MAHRSFCLQFYNAYSFTINTKEFYTINVVGKESVICNLYWTLAEVPDFGGWGGEEGKGGEAPGKIAEYPRA